jgi:hypothetical protein
MPFLILMTGQRGENLNQATVQHLVVAAHHGDETLSVAVALEFIQQALSAMNDPASPYHLDTLGKTFHVIPVLNIGGYNADRREERDASGRSFDPNRDYDDPCGGGMKFNLASTKALALYLIRQEITAAVTIHGYIGTFTFPWGTFSDQTLTPDHDLFVTVSEAVSEINGYRIGTHADVIYPTNGAFEDWAYHELGVWTTLLEIRRRPDKVKDAQGLLRYFGRVPQELSAFHDHLGDCREAILPIIGRP